MEKNQSRKVYYVFSPWTRLFHWLMVGSIAVLFTTGLYIGNPSFLGNQGLEPTYAVNNWFSMEKIRFYHFTAAYILLAAIILKIYGFLVSKGDRLFPHFWTKKFYAGAWDTILHYLFLRPRHRPYLRNSLARASYAGLYFLILIEIATGFAMYFGINPHSGGAMLFHFVGYIIANEYALHLVHHYVAWIIVLFAIVHVYMVIRDDLLEKNGETSSMIAGVKFFAEEPEDLRDIR
ncbi:nickel-dependent hydrogenase b-type cytochrome subunit [Lucifera butyrica]|uniref:Nickel-dependent hydrogenase b-type cytochrome subunit n=1 Tax=Lucifera butyrica TaxID=1351585 RepID=A0A498RCD0_9FIRM|nr:Ni/Fe-hydrogenase, b-type cytochrome subunit [Lucifera butyrica]VBB06808.1 nickel-dependent hydrogenase b-type cytochrome subunit [Lucifera butyrica]